MPYDLFVTCPKGLEYLLESEVSSLGLKVDKVSPQGVFGTGSLAVIYRLCLWSRVANRVQLVLFSGSVSSEATITQLCSQFPWQTIFPVTATFCVSFHGTNLFIRNTMYGAQLVKDGLVDYFRKLVGLRPSIDKVSPDVQLHAHLKQNDLMVSLDLSGGSLHQRAYRLHGGEAPLKENLAAALLMRAGWPRLYEQGYDFYDPFCGSGTLVIEAAMMAAGLAPGLLRARFGFQALVGYDESLWNKIKQEALSQVKPVKIRLIGSDASSRSIAFAKENAERAGVGQLVKFEVNSVEALEAISSKGLLMCNPPYGERLGDIASLLPLYQTLGQKMVHCLMGWEAAVLTENATLAKAIGLRSAKQYAFYNGKLACQLYLFHLNETNRLKTVDLSQSGEQITMIQNRLKKNESHLAKWARRVSTEAYRVYDADLPEYAFALDKYKNFFVLQEYLPPKTISPLTAEKRRLEMIQAVLQTFSLSADHLIIKKRESQKGLKQYEKINQKNQRFSVKEGEAHLLVNLHDYIDTGLFLEKRRLRGEFRALPRGTRFLNLFCYTATASVQAALAGALTTNVDLSNTYLRWAEDNFRENHLKLASHHFVAMDVLKWLKEARQQYDVIFMDPPSFSNSKKMENILDVQRDHVFLIDSAARLLSKEGQLYFCTNFRRFKLDEDLLERYTVTDITAQTLDEDFKRRPKVHHCYKIVRRTE